MKHHNRMKFMEEDNGGGSGGGGAEGQQGAPKSIIGGEPNPAPSTSFLDQIKDPSIKSDPSLKDIKDLDSLAKSYIHAQKMVGVEKIPAPNDKWTDTDWEAHHKRLGRPDAPDAYKFDVKEGIPRDEKYEGHMRAVLFKAGLSQKQVSEIVGGNQSYFEQMQKSQTEAAQRAVEEGISELKKEWGADFESKINKANLAIKTCCDEKTKAKLDQYGVLNDPDFARLFSNIGNMLSEDQAIGGGNGGFVTSKEHAISEIGNLKLDKDFQDALINRNNPAHREALEKWQNLFKVAYPDKK